MATTKFYTEDEALDKVLGKEGTPLRNQYESEMNAFLMGEAIKKARQSKNLTQEELGALIGVKKSQVSRIEKGNNMKTIRTVKDLRELIEQLDDDFVIDFGVRRKLTEEELKNIIWKDIKEINKTLPKYKYIKNLIITDEPMIKTTTQKVKRYEEIKKL